MGINTFWSQSDAPVPQSYTDQIVAHAGGGQANAMPLATTINRVTTVANAGDSVKMPAAKPGVNGIIVTNAAATNSMNLFPLGSDQINGAGAAAAFAIAAGKTAILSCAASGQWHAVLSA